MEALAGKLVHEHSLACCGVVPCAEQLTSAHLLATPDLIVCESQTYGDLMDIQRRAPTARLVAVVNATVEANCCSAPGERIWPWQVTTGDSLTHFLTVIRAAASSGADETAVDVQHARVDNDPVSAEEQLSVLNARELEVFTLLAQGRSVKEVAILLGASFKAIDSQKYRIMRKLGLTDRVQATRLAIRAGLINP